MGFRVRIVQEPIMPGFAPPDISTGATVTFTGTVRGKSRARTVVQMDYEGYHPMALSELEKISRDVFDEYGLRGVDVTHRLGSLSPGEISVHISVTASHRREAFDACQDIINRIKKIVPIWKKEIYEDGTFQWVHCTH